MLPRRELPGWTSELVFIYATTDIGIGLVFFIIGGLLAYIAIKAQYIANRALHWLFTAFLFSVSLSHFCGALEFAYSVFYLTAGINVCTAIISFITIIFIIKEIPVLVATQSPEQIKHLYATMAQDKLIFKILVDSVKDYSILILNPEGYIKTWNSGAGELQGYTAKELINQHFSIFYTQEALDKNWPMTELKLAKEQGHFEDEGWRIRKDGSKYWANVTITPLYDENNSLLGFAKVTRNLTGKREHEEAIRQLNETLHTRLAAAEAFNRMTVHDLNAPLRSLEGFSEILLEDCKTKVDEETFDYIRRIRDASLKMRQLIKDMERLAQVTQPNMELHLCNTNLSDMAEHIIHEHKMAYPKKGNCEIIIQPEIYANVDKDLFQLALYNMISNAWKFTSHNTDARIEFGVIEIDGQKVYYVKDNGAGFDQTKADKLFEPFQRLHTQAEFPGNGIGLTIVKRVVTLHRGRVWAEGKIGEGATFYFTIGI
jgi:PAS domain S-box-containing protein